MQAWTTRDLGAIIRGRRRLLGWTQAQLAEAIGATRAWVVAIEHGKASAEIGLAIRALVALGMVIDIVPITESHGSIDLDELLGE
jgi:HTH-type transcriptional regulator / antitoxin HipB